MIGSPLICILSLVPLIRWSLDDIMSNLIDSHRHYWNTTLMNNLFIPMETELIMNFPLNQNFQSDYCFWFLEKKESLLSRYKSYYLLSIIFHCI